MTSDPFADWDGTAAQARVLQKKLAGQVSLVDDFGNPRLLAGVDVGFEEQGAITRAVAVLLDADSLMPLAHALVRLPTNMAYVPGLLSFRELPAVLQALAELPQTPGLVFCDGHGIAHPRRLGIAAHLGVVSGLPTIGVAKKILAGHHGELADARGSKTPLLDRTGEPLGWALRSKDRVKPLIVSPGHRVSLTSAADWVLACVRRHRLPEPTRLADHLASRRSGSAATRALFPT